MRSEVHLPAGRAVFAELVERHSEFTKGRFRIRKEDSETFGYTAACPGFSAVSRGATAPNQSEEFRKGVAETLEKFGSERPARETEMLFEHLEKEETERLFEHLEEEESEQKEASERRQRRVRRVRRPAGRRRRKEKRREAMEESQ